MKQYKCTYKLYLLSYLPATITVSTC